MAIQSLLIYVTMVLVATITPGPAVLYIMTNATLHGYRKSVFAALGNITGLFCLGVIAITGLGSILYTSEIIFNMIRYAGAAYLIYLGLKLIFKKQTDFSKLAEEMAPARVDSSKVFIQALSIAMSNPKAIVFLTALFPQFINTGRALIPQFSILIAILMGFSFCFLMLYALLAHKARTWIGEPDRMRNFNKISGSIFIGFGLLLARSSNR